MEIVMRKIRNMNGYRLFVDGQRTKWTVIFSPYDNRNIQGKWKLMYGLAFRGLFDTKEEAFKTLKYKCIEKVADKILGV